MLALLLLLSSSPLLLATDHGVIILGGEGPDGPLDTVAVLTESGWCPPENIIIPSLPLAATGLIAHHGNMNAQGEREYLVLCGFPGETSCFQISPLNGHFVWTPVGVEDIDMEVLEYVHSYDNMNAQGEREYLVLCGFPGETSCFQISPLNGHFVWTPVG